MATTILSVPDISCEHCQKAITGALIPVAGVQSVDVDIATKKVTVQYDPSVVTVDRFKELLAEEEYPVESAS